MTDIEYLKKYLDEDKYEEGIKKYEQGIPVQYIVGNVDFYGNKINVNENVLIPRFETEELVYRTIKYSKKIFDKKLRIVDIGTGSGCIAITLKKELDSDVIAVDISEKALEVAKYNAKQNNVEITFLQGNLTEPLEGKFDIIVSNPPYIGMNEEIMDLVYKNEPHQALFANNNGLACYEEILTNIKKYLNDTYLIAFEIGEKQGEYLTNYIKKILPQSNISLEQDLQGRNRYIFISNKIYK